MDIFKSNIGKYIIALWDELHQNYQSCNYTREYKNWHRANFGTVSIGWEFARSIETLANDSNLQSYTTLYAAKKALKRDY
jgi:hypothetical protein